MADEFPMDADLLAESPEMSRREFSPDSFELGLVTNDKGTEGSEDRTACTCVTCGKVFNSVWYLKQHAVKHSSERPFRCKHCQKTYRFRSNLYQHKCPQKLAAHVNGNPVPSTSQAKPKVKSAGRLPPVSSSFVQSDGGQPLRPSAELPNKDAGGSSERRINTVSQVEVDRFLERHREKLHRCAKCKIYFPTREYLQQHTAWHNNDAKVKCLHCSQAFDDDLSYASHKTSHTPQSHHVCQHCRGKFAHRLALKKHLVRCTNAPHLYTSNWGKVMDRSPARQANSPNGQFYRDSPDENPSSVGSAPSIGSTNGSRSSGAELNISATSHFTAEHIGDGVGLFHLSAASSTESPSDWVGTNSSRRSCSPLLAGGSSHNGDVEIAVISRRRDTMSSRLKLSHIKGAAMAVGCRPTPLHLLNPLPPDRIKYDIGNGWTSRLKVVLDRTVQQRCDNEVLTAAAAKSSFSAIVKLSVADRRQCDQEVGRPPRLHFICANCGCSFPSKQRLLRHIQRKCEK